MRVYDPRIGKFLSVDPLTKKYAWNSPYSYAEGDVIRSVDLDGLEKFNVVTSSFAPFNIFGKDGFGGYFGDGDSRKFGGAPFSTNGDIGKYRTMGAVGFDMSNLSSTLSSATGRTTSTYHRANWNPFTDFTATSPTHIEFDTDPVYSKASNYLSFRFHTYGSDQAILGANPFVRGLPEIDNHINLNVTKVGETKIRISGAVFGDRFPSNETYLMDEKGGTLMLGVSGANRGQAGPYFSLWGDAQAAMSSFSFDILLNDDHSFKGVQLKDKFFTPAEWNKQFSNLDPKEGKGSVTGDSGVSTQSYDDKK